jgi:PKD repeat protein
VAYAWDFGDGGFGDAAGSSHSYPAAGAYTVVLTVTDDGGATDSDAQTISLGGSAPTMRISAIDMTGKTAGSNRSAAAIVSVVDGDGNPVSGATVIGGWGDAYAVEVIGTTGAEGTVSFTSGKVRQVNAKFSFTVENVVKDGFLYDAEHSVTSAWIVVP